MTYIISDPIWTTIREKVKERNLTELLNIYNVNNLDYDAKGGRYKRTVLHVAAEQDEQEIVCYLIQHGADVGTKSNYGYSPLHGAARNNRVELAKLLLQHGADVNTKSNNGYTLLHEAAHNNRVEVAKLLLQHGADVNTKSNNGYTLLHGAARCNTVEVAKLLLQHGADISTKDIDNESALQYMQKIWSNNDLQDTFRALPNGVKYSNPGLIVNELEIKDDFDDDVKSILSNILKEAIDKLPDIINDPKQRLTFYRGDLYVRLVKEILKRSGETTLLHTIYIALQAKTPCNQLKREILKNGLGYDIFEQFQTIEVML
ncbi:poly [ADP-ribose] polymerase tankyrase-2-like [Bolinopsis microptera]|uniref:poly [ADP-ribose] polymerase tankyrase-2-like n=1 Tax=Bolinopsis microptera TaxID=2820187 RepID=UPI0030791487